MEIIETYQQQKNIKFLAKKSLSDRLDILKDQAKKNKVVFNFNQMMESHAEILIKQAEDKFKKLSHA